MSSCSFALPSDFADYEWEVTAKGCFSEARITVPGKQYRLNFYDAARLGPEIESELENGDAFFEPDLVIVRSVTRTEMERARATAGAIRLGGIPDTGIGNAPSRALVERTQLNMPLLPMVHLSAGQRWASTIWHCDGVAADAPWARWFRSPKLLVELEKLPPIARCVKNPDDRHAVRASDVEDEMVVEASYAPFAQRAQLGMATLQRDTN